MLENLTDDQLREEINRREKERKAKNKPIPLAILDTKALQISCRDYILHLDKEGIEPKNGVHCIFEIAMEAVYGKGVWVWIRKQLI